MREIITKVNNSV